jgi:hypothetical protein
MYDAVWKYGDEENGELTGVSIPANTVAKIVRLYRTAEERGLPRHVDDAINCGALLTRDEVLLATERGKVVYRDGCLVGWYDLPEEPSSEHGTAARRFERELPKDVAIASLWVNIADAEGVGVPKEWRDLILLDSAKKKIPAAMQHLTDVATAETIMRLLGVLT